MGLRYLFGLSHLALCNLTACHVLCAVMLGDLSDDEGHAVEVTAMDFHVFFVGSGSEWPMGRTHSPLDLKQQKFAPASPPPNIG